MAMPPWTFTAPPLPPSAQSVLEPLPAVMMMSPPVLALAVVWPDDKMMSPPSPLSPTPTTT